MQKRIVDRKCGSQTNFARKYKIENYATANEPEIRKTKNNMIPYHREGKRLIENYNDHKKKVKITRLVVILDRK